MRKSCLLQSANVATSSRNADARQASGRPWNQRDFGISLYRCQRERVCAFSSARFAIERANSAIAPKLADHQLADDSQSCILPGALIARRLCWDSQKKSLIRIKRNK
jgi:hypothetical protein